MKPTKQPLITIEGKDCTRCHAQGKHAQKDIGDRVYWIRNCKKCQGKGKSPTKLIVDAEDFKCFGNQGKILGMKVDIGHELCICKNTGYILLKKGDKYYCWHASTSDVWLTEPEYKIMLSALDEWMINETKEETDIFCLSSDAVLMTLDEFEVKENLEISGVGNSYSPNMKIVIAEGYYEM